jgi:hypothetical protein
MYTCILIHAAHSVRSVPVRCNADLQGVRGHDCSLCENENKIPHQGMCVCVCLCVFVCVRVCVYVYVCSKERVSDMIAQCAVTRIKLHTNVCVQERGCMCMRTCSHTTHFTTCVRLGHTHTARAQQPNVQTRDQARAVVP